MAITEGDTYSNDVRAQQKEMSGKSSFAYFN